MAGKVWMPNRAKKFAKEVKLGKPYYVAVNIATNLAPYEDSQLYSEYVFTNRQPFTGIPLTDGGYGAASLCLNCGPVYEEPPAGLRNMAGPAPQVAGPLPAGYEGVLDEAEIRGLEKQVGDGSHPRKRRPAGSWRV